MFVLVENISFTQLEKWKIFLISKLKQEFVDVYLLKVDIVLKDYNSIIRNIQNRIESIVYNVSFENNYSEIFFENSSKKPDENDIVINLTNIEVEKIQLLYGNVKIWDLLYHNMPISMFSHLGEYELLNKLPTIDIYLRETHCGTKSLHIDVARYNLHYSAVRNFMNVSYSLHFLLIKNVKKCATSDCELPLFNNDYSYIRYLSLFYSNLLKKITNRILNKCFGFYNEKWTLGFGVGSFINNRIEELVIIKMPKGEFWADPFLFKYGTTNYVFFERFPFKEKKGLISCGIFDTVTKTINNVSDVLTLPYHLSYPFVFEEDNDIYMIPECSENKGIEVYRALQFPNKWELYSVAFKEQSLVDTIYYCDLEGNKWLFATLSDSDVDMHCTVLNIYKIDSLQFNKIESHRKNPIIIDSTYARNAGRIYIENGKLYRVAQNNSHGIYGYGVKIKQIVKLTLDEYEEIEVIDFPGNNIPKAIGTHHMCQIDGMYVMDICIAQ